MNATIEHMIRERAHELWERAGKPKGRSDEFWFAARAEFELKGRTAERKLGVPVRQRMEVRCETAADWGKRRRDPSL